MVMKITVFVGFLGGCGPRLREEDGRLGDALSPHVEPGHVPQPDRLEGRRIGEQGPDGPSGRRDERLSEKRESGHRPGQAGEHLVELAILARLRELPWRGLLDVAIRARRELHALRRAFLESIAVHRPLVSGDALTRRLFEWTRVRGARSARHGSATIAVDHVEGTFHEIAKDRKST